MILVSQGCQNVLCHILFIVSNSEITEGDERSVTICPSVI